MSLANLASGLGGPVQIVTGPANSGKSPMAQQIGQGPEAVAAADATTKLRASAAKWLAIEESEGETQLEFAARHAARRAAARSPAPL